MCSTNTDTSSSRKRSKWDVDDPEDEKPATPEPQTKRRVLKASSEQRSLEPSPAPKPAPPRPAHSYYVPPRTHHPPIVPSRSVYCYERLNQIEEGSYGVVFRAKDEQTGDIVALKKLKLDEEKQGFPITALREINALMAARHENVVRIREVVVGETLTQYVAPFP